MEDNEQLEAQQSAQPEEQQEDKKAVPYERFREVNEKYRTLEARLKEYEAKQRQEEEKQLAEQNKWKELYEKLQAELKAREVENLRLRIASSKGLPNELVERLRGETEEELSKDADALLDLLGRRNEPRTAGVPPAPRNGNAAVVDLLKETDPEKIRKAWKQIAK